MAEDFGVFHGDDRSRYQQIKNSLVQVVCLLKGRKKAKGSKEVKNSSAKRRVKSIIAAAPVVAEENFCCLIALKEGLFYRDGYEFEVTFPNKKCMPLRREDLAIIDDGKLVMFAFHTSGKFVEAVKFGTSFDALDSILLAGYRKPKLVPCHVSPGRVTYQCETYFYHCSPYFRHTSRGDFVFNYEREVVGICYWQQGIIKALNVASIRSELAKLLDKQMANAPLLEIIKFIKDTSEEGKSDKGKRNATRNLDGCNPSKRSKTGSSAGPSAHV